MRPLNFRPLTLALLLAASAPLACASPAALDPDYFPLTEPPAIDESTITATIHVAAPAPGAPRTRADGSAARPFLSINAARDAVHANLEAGIPTRLHIAPGTYREDLRQFVNFRTADNSPALRETLLVIEGAAPGEVIISGSIEKNDEHDFTPATWTAVPGQPGLYRHPWPFGPNVDPGPWIDSYGFALLPGLTQRSEMLWFDGRPLRQVLAETYRWEDPDGPRGYTDRGTGRGGDPNNQPGQLVFSHLSLPDPAGLSEPFTFAVYTDPAAPATLRDSVFVRLPADLPITRVNLIEVALWKGRSWSPLLVARDKTGLVLRNLVFQHAGTGPLASAVTFNNVHDFLIEDCSFSDNVASGLQINRSSRGTLRRVTARDNGANGFGFGDGSRQILVEDSTLAFNNIRGAWSGWIAWHASASKSGGVTNLVFRRLTSIGNYANGLWFDVYCRDILVADSFFLGNKRMGVMFELTRPRGGPHVLRNSISAFNDNTGLYLSMASNSVVLDNLLVGNGGGLSNVEGEPHHTQLLFKTSAHPQGPKSADDWQSVVLHRNLLASAAPESSAINYLTRPNNHPEEQFPWVLAVLDTDHNHYWMPNPARAFRRPDGSAGNLDAWRALLARHEAPGGRDAHSRWALPGLDPDPAREFTAASTSAITARARTMGVPLPQSLLAEYQARTTAGRYAPPHFIQRVQPD